MTVVLWAEETRTYSWSRFCTVKCCPSVSKHQFSHMGSGFEPQTSEMGGECVTTGPLWPLVVFCHGVLSLVGGTLKNHRDTDTHKCKRLMIKAGTYQTDTILFTLNKMLQESCKNQTRNN